jgi:hypothetical protein
MYMENGVNFSGCFLFISANLPPLIMHVTSSYHSQNVSRSRNLGIKDLFVEDNNYVIGNYEAALIN